MDASLLGGFRGILGTCCASYEKVNEISEDPQDFILRYLSSVFFSFSFFLPGRSRNPHCTPPSLPSPTLAAPYLPNPFVACSISRKIRTWRYHYRAFEGSHAIMSQSQLSQLCTHTCSHSTMPRGALRQSARAVHCRGCAAIIRPQPQPHHRPLQPNIQVCE